MTRNLSRSHDMTFRPPAPLTRLPDDCLSANDRFPCDPMDHPCGCYQRASHEVSCCAKRASRCACLPAQTRGGTLIAPDLRHSSVCSYRTLLTPPNQPERTPRCVQFQRGSGSGSSRIRKDRTPNDLCWAQGQLPIQLEPFFYPQSVAGAQPFIPAIGRPRCAAAWRFHA